VSFSDTLIVRPPDIVCRRTYILPGFFFSFLFFRRLISELAERNSTKIGHVLGSNACPKSGVSLPLQIGSPKTFFGPTSQLNGNFNGLYRRNGTQYRQLVKCVDNYEGSPISPKMSWTLVHKRLQTRPAFLSNLRKFCIPFHCQASHTEISKEVGKYEGSPTLSKS